MKTAEDRMGVEWNKGWRKLSRQTVKMVRGSEEKVCWWEERRKGVEREEVAIVREGGDRRRTKNKGTLIEISTEN
jgi:hypothetical protein